MHKHQVSLEECRSMKGVTASEVVISDYNWQNSGIEKPEHDLIVGSDEHKQFVLMFWRSLSYVKLDHCDEWYEKMYKDKDKIHLKLERFDKQGKYSSAFKIVKRSEDLCLFHIFNTTFEWGILQYLPFKTSYSEFCSHMNDKLGSRVLSSQ
jgi:hypothetical protein